MLLLRLLRSSPFSCLIKILCSISTSCWSSKMISHPSIPWSRECVFSQGIVWLSIQRFNCLRAKFGMKLSSVISWGSQIYTPHTSPGWSQGLVPTYTGCIYCFTIVLNKDVWKSKVTCVRIHFESVFYPLALPGLLYPKLCFILLDSPSILSMNLLHPQVHTECRQTIANVSVFFIIDGISAANHKEIHGSLRLNRSYMLVTPCFVKLSCLLWVSWLCFVNS